MAWLVGVLVLIVGVGAAVLYVLWRSVDPDQGTAPRTPLDRTARTTAGDRDRGAASTPAPAAARADVAPSGADTGSPRDAGEGTAEEAVAGEDDEDSGLELFALVSADQQDERSGHLTADLRRRAGERVRGQRDRHGADGPAAVEPSTSEQTAAAVPRARSASVAPVRQDAPEDGAARGREAPSAAPQDAPSVESGEESPVGRGGHEQGGDEQGRDERDRAEVEPQVVTPVAMSDDEVWDRILAMVRGESGS